MKIQEYATGDAKTFLESIYTGAKSPEEILESLDKIGIEWHVTEEGTLMMRYWQVGAEDFVSPEKAAVIRTNKQHPEEGDEMDWLSKNLQNVREEYGGQWIAIYKNAIAAAAPKLPDLMDQIAGLDQPFVTFIPVEPVVWTFTYAN